MHADRHLSRFQDKNPALSTNRCWFLGEDGEDCSSVCGGLEAVDVEGTRAGSSSYAVVTCIEAEILGGSNIRHDVSAHARATANSLRTCCANALTPHDDRTQWT